MLRRLRAVMPTGKLILLWDGAPYHRAKAVWSAAASLDIHLLALPGYSPDLMAVEPLWRWLREDVTYHHCHATAEDLIRRVAAFEADDQCQIPTPSPIASGSRITSIPRRRNYGSPNRRGLGTDRQAAPGRAAPSVRLASNRPSHSDKAGRLGAPPVRPAPAIQTRLMLDELEEQVITMRGQPVR